MIREKLTLEAFELLEIFCDFLLARFAMIERERSFIYIEFFFFQYHLPFCSKCPADLREAVCTIIWASSRCDDVRELQEVTNQFKLKYGKEFVEENMRSEEHVHLRVTSLFFQSVSSYINSFFVSMEQVVHRLNFSAPDHFVVIKQLSSIAKEFDVPWEAENVLEDPLVP